MKKFVSFLLLCTAVLLLLSACETPHVHSFGEWTMVKNPTCTESGERQRQCSCGEIQSQVIAASGHSYGEWKTLKPATCTTDGSKERVCKCGDKQTQVIIAAGHKWTNATCTEPKKCTTCGTTSGKALGHTTKNGKCSRCGQNIYPEVKLPSKSGTYSYISSSNRIYSSAFISSVTYEYDQYGDLRLYFTGSKTYDYEGTSGTTRIRIYVKVLDEDGYTVKAEYFDIYFLHVGDKFKNETYAVYRSEIDRHPSSYYTVIIEDSKL